MPSLHFPSADARDFDVAFLGRLAVDLYAQQIGCSLEEAHSFNKYLGGSSGSDQTVATVDIILRAKCNVREQTTGSPRRLHRTARSAGGVWSARPPANERCIG